MRHVVVVVRHNHRPSRRLAVARLRSLGVRQVEPPLCVDDLGIGDRGLQRTVKAAQELVPTAVLTLGDEAAAAARPSKI